MRILILNQYCAPEPNFKSVDFAAALMGKGHEVRILTGFPNYPGGKIFPGYRLRLWQREVLKGVPILRVPLYPSHDRSAIRRIANYLTFMGSSALPLLTGWRPDLIYVWNLPTLGMLSAIASFLRNVPYVMDVQDLWPEAVVNSGMASSPISTLVRRLCQTAYGRAAGLITLSPGFKRALSERGIPAERIEVIYNWCEEHVLSRPTPGFDTRIEGFENRFNILFAGMMNRAQALDSVIEAARITGRQNPRIQFVFLGSGREEERLRTQAGQMAADNVRFLARVPMATAAQIMRQADVLLVHLRKNPLYSITIPSKTGSNMLIGRPILMGVEGDARDLVLRAQAGVACEPENPQSIADAALQLAALPSEELRRMGQRGQEFYDRELSMRVGVDRFDAFFRRIVAQPTRPGLG